MGSVGGRKKCKWVFRDQEGKGDRDGRVRGGRGRGKKVRSKGGEKIGLEGSWKRKEGRDA